MIDDVNFNPVQLLSMIRDLIRLKKAVVSK